jgi:hypothetical protein
VGLGDAISMPANARGARLAAGGLSGRLAVGPLVSPGCRIPRQIRAVTRAALIARRIMAPDTTTISASVTPDPNKPASTLATALYRPGVRQIDGIVS